MGYISRHLGGNETIHYMVHHHWIIFFSWRSLITLLIYPISKILFYEFAITNKRIIVKTGVLQIRTVELSIEKIETINAEQPILGRILRYGDIIIVGAGGTIEKYQRVANPIRFRKKFQEVEFTV